MTQVLDETVHTRDSVGGEGGLTLSSTARSTGIASPSSNLSSVCDERREPKPSTTKTLMSSLTDDECGCRTGPLHVLRGRDPGRQHSRTRSDAKKSNYNHSPDSQPTPARHTPVMKPPTFRENSVCKVSHHEMIALDITKVDPAVRSQWVHARRCSTVVG